MSEREEVINWKMLLVSYGGLQIKRKKESSEPKNGKGELIKALEKHSEISSISDISLTMEQMFSWITYTEEAYKFPVLLVKPTPLILHLHLPDRLQTNLNETKDLGLVPDKIVEDFIVVIDGFTMLIAAICPEEEPTTVGSIDVMNKLKEILEVDFEVKQVAPYISHTHLHVINGENPDGERDFSHTIYISQTKSLDEIVANLYYDYIEIADIFYSASEQSHDLRELADKIKKDTKELYNSMAEYVNSKSSSFLNRMGVLNSARKTTFNTLKEIADYNDQSHILQSEMEHIESEFSKPEYKNFPLNDFRWKMYIEPMEIDVNSITRLLEYIREERKSFFLALSTVSAAIIGGIIGAILSHL